MSGRSSKRGRSGGGFTLRQPPVVDVGCNCRCPRLFSVFSSSSSSLFRGGGKPKSPNASSTSTTTAFTATTAGGRSGTTATSTDSSSWGPASFVATNSLYDDPVPVVAPPQLQEREQQEARRRRRQQQQQRRRRRRAAAAPARHGAEDDDEYGRRVARESVAVAVDSAEPYEDFRESMVQMVVEKEIYAWDDLNDLLHQFLSLNSPRHHPLILHAFADLWTRNGLFCPPSPCQF
ncbi:plant-specific domain TIGR01568 family protein [Panicum miliaceum]|uniref:Transcription repressor n=1 Tax=Panicum miliaceum TaxID=4540 RepID=A0A3L6SPP6_PANMI|nr:plant-specific domain TIGR01568 family protein [Panicum miliaceum]